MLNFNFDLLKETKKYELVNPVQFEGRTLYRVKALKDFSDVKAGDVGGLVESELNLSHDGNCWIYDDAVAMGSSRVENLGRVKDNAKVINSTVTGNCTIVELSQVLNSTLSGGMVMGLSDIEDSSISGLVTVDNSFIKSSTVKTESFATIEDFSIVVNSNINVTGLYGNVNIGNSFLVNEDDIIANKEKTWLKAVAFN